MNPRSKSPDGLGDEHLPEVNDAPAHDDPVRPVPVVIGEFLKAHYRDLVDAPVPDHLVRLMEMLEQREAGDGSSSPSDIASTDPDAGNPR